MNLQAHEPHTPQGTLPVALLRHEAYTAPALRTAVGQVMDAASLTEYCPLRPGARVLVKPNLLLAMPLPLQVKLLSVLDDQEFFPLGGEKKVQVDVRIIAATHRPLKERVAAGLFREDLFYRLNVLHLHLPPLRERESDTRFLVNHFLRTFAARTGDEARTFTPAALEIIMAYPFPGNIRELRNVVEYCVNICPQGEMGVEHLPRTLLARALQPSAVETEPAREVATAPTAEIGGRDWLAIERELIVNTLTSTRGNRSRAAGILGWGRTTLWRKLKLHGLAPEAGDKGGQA